MRAYTIIVVAERDVIVRHIAAKDMAMAFKVAGQLYDDNWHVMDGHLNVSVEAYGPEDEHE